MRIAIGLAAALAAAACAGRYGAADGGSGPRASCTPENAVEATSVVLAGTSFTPACVKVRAGGAVTFATGDAMRHNVTTDAGQAESFRSPDLGAGQQFTHTFATPGKVDVHCTFHAAQGMRARIFVEP